MPGHVAKAEGPDPDPLPWLAVSDELSIKLKAKPYDAKKSCWVPNKATGGYDEGLIMEKDGEKITVELLETKEVQYVHYDTSCCPFIRLIIVDIFIYTSIIIFSQKCLRRTWFSKLILQNSIAVLIWLILPILETLAFCGIRL